MPVADAANALSIHYNSLYCWISEYEENEYNLKLGKFRKNLIILRL